VPGEDGFKPRRSECPGLDELEKAHFLLAAHTASDWGAQNRPKDYCCVSRKACHALSAIDPSHGMVIFQAKSPSSMN
jgi:hypothetical protein